MLGACTSVCDACAHVCYVIIVKYDDVHSAKPALYTNILMMHLMT